MSKVLIKIKRPAGYALLVGVIIALIFRFLRLAAPVALDFEVYWYAIHAWVNGTSPYDVYAHVYPGFVYKYPPWTLAFFLPFAWIGLETSKWAWAILQIFAIFYCNYWLVQKKVRGWVAVSVSLMFWWVWLAHGTFGQITLFLVVVALWAESSRFSKRAGFHFAVLTEVFSAKIFSMITLVGVLKDLLRVKTIMSGIVLFLFSHLLLLLTRPNWLIQGPTQVMFDLYRGWLNAAASGGADLGIKTVRGAQNHGFSKLILNSFHVDPQEFHYDIGVALLLSVAFGFLWNHFSKKLRFEEKWSGWIALGVICHPLAWNHSFVAAFPLCAFALNRAVEMKDIRFLISVLIGICCVGIFIPQVIGVDTVAPLELIAHKSWGVLICGISLASMSHLGSQEDKSKSINPSMLLEGGY